MKKKELPYTDMFITDGKFVRDCVRKRLKKRSRDFYFVKRLTNLGDDKWLVELEEEFKI